MRWLKSFLIGIVVYVLSMFVFDATLQLSNVTAQWISYGLSFMSILYYLGSVIV